MAKENQYLTSDAVVAILHEAKQAGVGKLTRTALTKYLYLLDYWMAKETNGKTYLGVDWKFYHFGPYSESIASHLDWAGAQASINKVDVSKQDKEFTLYSLSDYARPKTFEAIGLPKDVGMKLVQAIKAFAGDLTGLLNFVYFDTEPMDGAKPGNVLEFQNLSRTNFKKDVQTIKISIQNDQKAKRIQSLLSKIGDDWQKNQQSPLVKNPPVRDSIYAETQDEDLILSDGQEYTASLVFYHSKEK